MSRYSLALGKISKKEPEEKYPNIYHIRRDDVNFEICFGFNKYWCVLLNMQEDFIRDSLPVITMEITKLVDYNMEPFTLVAGIVGKRMTFKSPLGPKVELTISSYTFEQNDEDILQSKHILKGEILCNNITRNQF